MKNFYLLIAAFFFFSFTAFGQKISKKDVPSIIRNTFQQSFPNATDIKWKKKGDGYKVKFEIGNDDKDHTIWYNDDGKIELHKEEISKKDLPEAVRSTINKDYKWYIIKDIDKYTHGNQVTYEVELKSVSREWEVTFDPKGKVLKKKRD